jgi:hypothetical protein
MLYAKYPAIHNRLSALFIPFASTLNQVKRLLRGAEAMSRVPKLIKDYTERRRTVSEQLHRIFEAKRGCNLTPFAGEQPVLRHGAQ